MDSLKLDELAEQAGTSPRTVRYYVQRGLLPGPTFRGKDTVYSRDHLVRLRAIKRLQERFMPLDGIQAELARLSQDELEKLAGGKHVALLGPPIPIAPPQPPHPPHPQPAASGAVDVATRWTRRELVPGLELSVLEGASDDTRALAEEIRVLALSMVRQRGARK